MKPWLIGRDNITEIKESVFMCIFSLHLLACKSID